MEKSPNAHPVIFIKSESARKLPHFYEPELDSTASLTVHDVIKPVYYVLRPIALWPYKYANHNEIEPLNVKNALFACLLVILILSYYIYSAYIKMTYLIGNQFTVLAASDLAYSLSSHILVLASIWAANSKTGCLTKEFLLDFEKIRRDEIFATQSLRKKVLQQTVAILLTGTSFIMFNVACSAISVGSRDIKEFLSTYTVQFFTMFLFLKINVKVEILLQYFRGINGRFEACAYSQGKLRELLETHGTLCNMINLTNEGHGWEIVLLILTTASKILNSLHLAVIEGLGYLFADLSLWLRVTVRVAQIGSTIFYCGLIILLAAKCSRAKKEACKTGLLANDMLLKIPADNTDINVLHYKHELKLVANQILHRRPNFSAAGIFDVDYTVISTVLGVVTSYFIVVLQF